jgi:hypothetical protein
VEGIFLPSGKHRVVDFARCFLFLIQIRNGQLAADNNQLSIINYQCSNVLSAAFFIFFAAAAGAGVVSAKSRHEIKISLFSLHPSNK